MPAQSLIVIPRQEIPAITVRRHALLQEYMAENARLSMAWVHLEPGEMLAVQSHPTVSIIVVTRGVGRCLGDSESSFREGDVVVIPPGARHGFVGEGLDGYWALSVQVEGQGLYEKEGDARVSFGTAAIRPSALGRLLAFNDECTAEYENSALFAFIDGTAVQDVERRRSLLDAIQVWSNFYQRILRAALSDGPQFRPVAEELAADRAQALRRFWDPVLESAFSWFAWKMLTLDDAAKTALVHLVLGGGSNAFHARAQSAMSRLSGTKHFGVQDECDEDRLELGLAALEDLSETEYAYLTTVVREGWDMLTLICDRIADIATEERTGA